MNFVLSFILSLMMGASLTPTNPVIAAFMEEANLQAASAQEEGTTVTYEKTPNGYAVIIHQGLPVPSDLFSELPTDELKSEFYEGLITDPDTVDFLNVLKKENVNLILRFVSTVDNKSLDLEFPAKDL